MKDIKITKAIRNERDELQVSFICKEGDYTDIERVLLQDAKKRGDMLDVEFTGFVQGNEDEVIKKNRTILDLTLKDYCEHFGFGYDSQLSILYEREGIDSRKELSNSELETLIESYRVAIKTDIA